MLSCHVLILAVYFFGPSNVGSVSHLHVGVCVCAWVHVCVYMLSEVSRQNQSLCRMAGQVTVQWFCRKYPGSTIVTDSVTSNGLSEFIEAQGGKHYR